MTGYGLGGPMTESSVIYGPAGVGGSYIGSSMVMSGVIGFGFQLWGDYRMADKLSLGFVTATAGTNARATANRTTPAAALIAHGISFEALPSNTGKVFIGSHDMVKATGVGVLAILPAPASATTGPFPSYVLDMGDRKTLDASTYRIDVDTSTEGVVVGLRDVIIPLGD